VIPKSHTCTWKLQLEGFSGFLQVVYTCCLFNGVAGNHIPHLTLVAREGLNQHRLLTQRSGGCSAHPQRGAPARMMGWLRGLCLSTNSEKMYLSTTTMHFTSICCHHCQHQVPTAPAQPHYTHQIWLAQVFPGGGLKEQMTTTNPPPPSRQRAGVLHVTPARFSAGSGEQPRAQAVSVPPEPCPHLWAHTLNVTMFPTAVPHEAPYAGSFCLITAKSRQFWSILMMHPHSPALP